MPPNPTSSRPVPSPATSRPSDPVAIDHYENFPVASFLCPTHLRQPIAAIYHFARTADDIADEGTASAAERLAELHTYRMALACMHTPPVEGHWPAVFRPLAAAVLTHDLPLSLLHDLLDAFEQDVKKTDHAQGYATEAELRDYCRRSANPVGRLLLHLYGVSDPQALLRSDAICTALQLINFWQDLSVDIPRGRYYLPTDWCVRFAVPASDWQTLQQTENATKLIAACAHHARASMAFGSALVHQVPGRAGWELRLVVQGGLRILDRIAALNYATLTSRPTLGKWDYAVMVWRALWM